jgi:tetratricopeptide (TPR) repeat protein
VREPPPRQSKPKVISPARPAGDPRKKAAEDYQLAEEALARGDLKAADSHVVMATKGDPSKPDYAALFTWIAYKSGVEIPESVRSFSRILEDHPECQAALYYRGMLLKEAGKDRAALRDFVTVARLNPDHIKALAEVKLLRARMPKA